MTKIIVDPLGNSIAIPLQLLDVNEELFQSKDVYDNFTAIIEKPAMLFKMQNGTVELYYLRAIGWNKTVLLGVHKRDGHYEAFNFELDPTSERLQELHLKGERLI